jgi:dTDP-4-dehydrorhamnose 3,5-epimerase-like enzyme
MSKTLELAIFKTRIPGLLKVDLPIHDDNRGWFKENWQREKMIQLGLPDFHPVQNNVLFNKDIGVTRGIHAEPWDKYITISYGKVFAALVDLRPTKKFGTVEIFELTPEKALYVPRGCGNSFQTLTQNTVYSYFTNAHWSQEGHYTFVNLADKELAIDWPIGLDEVELSEKDKHQPMLSELRASLRNTLVDNT